MRNYTGITQEDKNNKFLEKARSIWGYKYRYPELMYINASTHITVEFDGIEYKQTPSKHLQGKAIELSSIKMPTSTFIDKSKEVWGGDRFDYSQCEYRSINDIMTLYDNHKQRWITQTPKSHLKGYEVLKLTMDEYVYQVEMMCDFKYGYESLNYNNLNDRVDIECPQHGVFRIKASSHFYKPSRCPQCTDFIGEQRIETFLNKHNVSFTTQHKFLNCVDVYIPFDFYIPSIRTVIEFRGMQNFTQLETFQEDSYQKLKRINKIKEDYCEENYIDIIIIKYDQVSKIEEIITNAFKRLNLL